jgi:hypothetical protein
LNIGQKEAKIRRVGALIMPDTFSILSKTTKEITGQLTTELPGEIILNPQPAIIKIQGGDGLHEWN